MKHRWNVLNYIEARKLPNHLIIDESNSHSMRGHNQMFARNQIDSTKQTTYFSHARNTWNLISFY
jgi:hypothetical protein